MLIIVQHACIVLPAALQSTLVLDCQAVLPEDLPIDIKYRTTCPTF